MTVQESIEVLSEIRSGYNCFDESERPFYEALSEAIESLSCSEKPNRSDTIYRQDAIDAVKRNTFRLTFAEEQNCEGHVAWSAEAVYSDVMEGELLELPSAQPEPVNSLTKSDLISKKKVRYKLTALVNEIEEIFANIREREVDDSVCGLCEYDGAYIGQSGDWCNECPGFEKDNCFKLKDKYRAEWESIDE